MVSAGPSGEGRCKGTEFLLPCSVSCMSSLTHTGNPCRMQHPPLVNSGIYLPNVQRDLGDVHEAAGLLFPWNPLKAARNKHKPWARPGGRPGPGAGPSVKAAARRREARERDERGGRRHVVWGRLGDQACHQRDPEDRRRGEGDGHSETPRARAAPAGPEPGVGLLGAALRPPRCWGRCLQG